MFTGCQTVDRAGFLCKFTGVRPLTELASCVCSQGVTSGQKSDNKSSAARTSSENEYTYIPEHVTPTSPHHVTTGNPTSSTYNVPGDHLANRKLPIAPARRAEQTSSADQDDERQMAAVTNVPAGAYSLASRPESDERNSRPYFELEGEKEATNTPKCDGRYFVLEEERNSSAGSAPASGREETAQSSQPPSQREGYYSPLTAASRGGQDGEYTSLDSNKTDTTGAREYLELLPDYSLQKPLD